MDGTASLATSEIFEVRPESRISLSTHRPQVDVGDKIQLRWDTSDSRDVRLWHTASMPYAPEPLNWTRIVQLAEQVPPQGERELTIERDTAFYLVAISDAYVCGTRLLVEMRKEAHPEEIQFACEPPEGVLQKMSEAPHVTWWDTPVSSPYVVVPLNIGVAGRFGPSYWMAGPPGPPISMNVTAQVIFTDESSLITWNVPNATCVSTSFQADKTTLVPDATVFSGSKYDGGSWGVGGSPLCTGPNPGSWNLMGQQWGPRHIEAHVSAKNAMGVTSSVKKEVDILGVPQFQGAATTLRKAAVRQAYKEMTQLLRAGRVKDDAFLDTQVKAFQKGYLNRQQVWARLLAELQNLNITTIKCEDAPGAHGNFSPFSGTITLRWWGGYGPGMPYVPIHELVHKVSLTLDETDTDAIASAILGIPPG